MRLWEHFSGRVVNSCEGASSEALSFLAQLSVSCSIPQLLMFFLNNSLGQPERISATCS